MEKYEQMIGGGYAQRPRSSNLELFRIITMLLIVAHHYVVNSGVYSTDGPIFSDPLAGNSVFLLIFGAFGKTGINCFMLITGYFMCKSAITAKKFCKLLFEVEFYKIVIWLVFLLTGYEAFSFTGLLEVLLPVRTLSTGFTSCYLVFFLFIPFLNILIRNMNEKQHIKLLLLCAFMYIVMGTIPIFSITMNYVSWFAVLYFIGSYIRLYEKKLFSNMRFWGISTVILLIASALSVIAMTYVGVLIGQPGRGSHFFLADSNKVLAVLLAVSSFLFFKNLNLKANRFINATAASAFGVLMIHANSDAMRKWLWKDLLDVVGTYDSDWMVLHAVGSVLAIYIICTAIDYLRIRFIEKPFFRFWDKHWDKLKDKYLKYEEKVCEILKIQG